MLNMYQSDLFYISDYNDKQKAFSPNVTSAFKILADDTYCHYCYEEEKQNHPKNTVAFIRCTDGKGLITLKENKITISGNECIFIKFHTIKEYKSLSNVWGYRWVNFNTNDIVNAFEFNKLYTIPFSENEEKAFNKLLAIGQTDLNNKGYLNALFSNYFYTVMLENQLDEESLLPDTKNRLIDEICSYIQQKLYSRISIEEIAVFFNISPRRLHQIFTEHLNISPKKYILKRKMEEGYKLLVQTPAPINKISDMLCFSSPYHFSNEFKKTFSQSPSEVRKMEQNYRQI